MTATNPDTKNPVIAAIDFSEDSKAALAWACKFAELNDNPLIILHIVHDMASSPGFYHPKRTEYLQPMQEVAESMMDEFLAEFRNDHPNLPALETADVQLVPGLPPSRIVEVAGLLNACLIAMGGRGMTGHSHKRLGMVAERVAELSFLPVVLVKSESHGVLGKKELKRRDKRRKKDRIKLKDILGLGDKQNDPADVNE